MRIAPDSPHLRAPRLGAEVHPVVPTEPEIDRRRHGLAGALEGHEEALARAAQRGEARGRPGFPRDLERAGMARAVKRPVLQIGKALDDAHTGITPCLRHGRSTFFVPAIRRPRMIVGRVSRGSMMSSIIALPAAM